MKLTKFRVTNFRSIEDSGEVTLEQMLCLVGKNEAGKSALLHGLAGLNPHPATPITFDIERDYPRRYLPEYKRLHADKPAVVIHTEWELSPSERNAISASFGDKALNGAAIVVERRYGQDPEWSLPIDFPAIVAYLIEHERLNAIEKKPLASAETTDALREALEKLSEPSEKQKRLLERLTKMPGKNATGGIKALLQPLLPHFMYFAHYDRMEGQIRLDTFKAREAGSQKPPIDQSERVFVDFLEYAGTSIEEILSLDTFEGLNARCEGASNRITQQLLEYWTQNPNLEIEVRVTKAESGDAPPFNAGVIARARVKNNLHKVTVPFSERSAGFIWFFSFLVKFAQVQKDGGSLILMLDEPGLTLHGKAQADLLRYFEDQLCPKHQVVFSTHSPFMVPADRLPEVRIVEDKISSPRPGQWISEGTKVRGDALATDRDTLFPLQGALGYELTQSLFVGEHTALVEGPGDILYLQAWSAALAKRGRTKIDPKWTLCPAGGIDKIQPFVSLFSGAKLDIAVLSDFAKSDKRKLDALRQNRLLENDRLLTFASVLGLEEADVEDVFEPELYLKIVNESFSLKEQQLTLEALNKAPTEASRLVKRVEALFNIMPPSAPTFDHYTPAEWLFRNPAILEGDSVAITKTLDRAENVIKVLNAVLHSA